MHEMLLLLLPLPLQAGSLLCQAAATQLPLQASPACACVSWQCGQAHSLPAEAPFG